jgi:hypothetical protein
MSFYFFDIEFFKYFFGVLHEVSSSWLKFGPRISITPCIVYLSLIEILTKIINHTNKKQILKHSTPVIYGTSVK